MSSRGSGRGRGRGGRHPAGNTGQVCRFFRSGKCTFGQRCRFSHDPTASASSAQTRAPRQRESTDERVLRFKRLVSARSSGSGTSDQSPFVLGLEILTSVEGASALQQTITALASEDGLSCIRHLAESRIPRAVASRSTYANKRIWETDLRPLFRIVTSKSVVCSNILKDKVSAIYNFLAGVGGTRLETWFGPALRLARAPDRPESVSSIEVAELCLAVLATMLDCNAAHVASSTFRGYAEDFISMAADSADIITPDTKMYKIQAAEYAGLVTRRLEAGKPSPAAASRPSDGPVAIELHQDLPGSLSGEGPRHDNDHEDIADISLLPTADEIASTRSEYLPAVDPALWHRPGIAGRLDREFRLLREDTIGQLRNVVRTELGNLQAGMGTNYHRGSPKNARDSIRYCTYHNASITQLNIDRRTGPEFLFRFRQPAEASSRRGTSNPASDEQVAKSLDERRNWWLLHAKKRLQPGGLVCAIDSQGSSHFLTVADSTVRSVVDPEKRHDSNKNWQQHDKEKDDGGEFTLADDSFWSFVRLNLPSGSDDNQLQLILSSLFFDEKMDRFTRSETAGRGLQSACVLVEFPGILLDSFMPTLRALQAASTSLNVPFADMLASSRSVIGPGSIAAIPAPKYAQRPGFTFDMSCLSRFGFPLDHSVDSPISAKMVEEQTRLDTTQSGALIDALSRSVALVQGPPGTGKTFAGVEMLKVLLHNRSKAELGPILIVCYTNHALDQLLEHILDARAKTEIIRMGSRSKSVRLKDMGLYEKSRAEPRTHSERVTLAQNGSELDELVQSLQKLLGRLGWSTTVSAIVAHLQQHHKHYFGQIFGYGADDRDGIDDEGFEMVREKKENVFTRWMRGNAEKEQTPTGLQETRDETCERLRLKEKTARLDLSLLTANERAALVQLWAYESFSAMASAIREKHAEFVQTKAEYDQARRETDLRCLQSAEIVGVTTTGLARNLGMLRNLRSKVLLCEEAGEVLEAHMLTSLIPSLEHVILIGDHQQLRPQVQNFDLRSDNMRGAQYSFDMSLFERLVSPVCEDEMRLPFSQLFTQRRMHPSISDLIRAPLYPSLEDGPNVLDYPAVPGFERRLFWLQHTQLEKGASSGDRHADPTSTSRTNPWEVEMTAALVAHLLKQGVYGPGDIAVLTPYVGQMMLLQRRMSGMFEIALNERDEADLDTIAAVTATVPEKDSSNKAAAVPTRTALAHSVRIATVDNFQGEEAKVVVVSMVRSNEEQRCGFLSTSNRINVLLSRAQHGMYLIGNSETCSRVPMWRQVLGLLEAGGNIGPSIPLQCVRHPERTFAASAPEHFGQFAPDGGCQELCNKPLPCKHICPSLCHSDVLHSVVKCAEPCERPQKGCSHACPRTCSEACPPRCTVVLTGQTVKLPCGHSIDKPACWQMQSPDKVKCLAKVRHTVPGCGHVVSLKCGTDTANYTCKATCGSGMPCGHSCPRICCECSARNDGEGASSIHGPCLSPCRRLHKGCEHRCGATCHADEAGKQTPCPPCAEPCTVRCSHGPCRFKCAEPCMPCPEKTCAVHCQHSSCSLPCAVPCDWVPCSERCDKVLSCGHACPSLCGEKCPSEAFCQVCAGPEILAQVVDLTTMATYGSVDMAASPCMFLGCGHVLTVSYMDGIMGMGRHYAMEAGCPVALKAFSPVLFGTIVDHAACPHCHRPPCEAARYSRVVRQRQWGASVKKATVRSHDGLVLLVNRLEALEQHKNGLFSEAPANGGGQSGQSMSRMKLVRSSSRTVRLAKLLKATGESRYRAFAELRNQASAHSQRTREEEERCSGFGETMRMGGGLQARLLLLRCDVMALWDMAYHLGSRTKCDAVLPVGVDAQTVVGVKAVARAIRGWQLDAFVHDSEEAIAAAQAAKNVRQEVEAKLIFLGLVDVVLRLLNLVATRPWCTTGEDGDWKSWKKENEAEIQRIVAVCKDYGASAKTTIYENPAAADFQKEEKRLVAVMSIRGMPDEHYARAYAGYTVEAYRAVCGRVRQPGWWYVSWYVCANQHAFTPAEGTVGMGKGLRCPDCNARDYGMAQLEQAMEAMGL